jgi:hypothetical protein
MKTFILYSRINHLTQNDVAAVVINRNGLGFRAMVSHSHALLYHMQAVATLGDGCEAIDVPRPAILKPIPLWSGKQVFNLLLRPNRNVKLHATFELKARNYIGPADKTMASYMCPDDGYVVFRDGYVSC